MFGFDRKEVLMAISKLIDNSYGTYHELIQLTIQEMLDIFKVLKSIEQERALKEAGM